VGRTGFHPVYIINASTILEEQNKEDTKECIAFFPVLKIPKKFKKTNDDWAVYYTRIIYQCINILLTELFVNFFTGVTWFNPHLKKNMTLIPCIFQWLCDHDEWKVLYGVYYGYKTKMGCGGCTCPDQLHNQNAGELYQDRFNETEKQYIATANKHFNTIGEIGIGNELLVERSLI